MDDNDTNINNNVLGLEQLNNIKKEEERMQDAVDDLYERVLTILMDDTDTITNITTNNNNTFSSFLPPPTPSTTSTTTTSSIRTRK